MAINEYESLVFVNYAGVLCTELTLPNATANFSGAPQVGGAAVLAPPAGCAFVNGQQVLELLNFDSGSVAQCLFYLLIIAVSVHTAAYYCLVSNTQVGSMPGGAVTLQWEGSQFTSPPLQL